MENNNSKKRVAFVFSCILTALATIAMVFYVLYIVVTVQGILSYEAGNDDLGTGLQKAFGLIFSLIFGIPMVVFSGGGIVSAFFAVKNEKSHKVIITGKVFTIVNSVYIIGGIISFIVVMLLV